MCSASLFDFQKMPDVGCNYNAQLLVMIARNAKAVAGLHVIRDFLSFLIDRSCCDAWSAIWFSPGRPLVVCFLKQSQ